MSKESKVKKPFYKKWWVWVLAVIIVIGISNTGEESATEATDSTDPATELKEIRESQADLNKQAEQVTGEDIDGDGEVAKKEEPKKKPAPKNDPGISLDEFNSLENGMTYEDAIKVIGGEGEVMSEVGEKGTDYYTIMYKFDGEKGLGANANLTFQDNKLQMKAQFGLK